jgi:hypothetical protein
MDLMAPLKSPYPKMGRGIDTGIIIIIFEWCHYVVGG